MRTERAAHVRHRIIHSTVFEDHNGTLEPFREPIANNADRLCKINPRAAAAGEVVARQRSATPGVLDRWAQQRVALRYRTKRTNRPTASRKIVEKDTTIYSGILIQIKRRWTKPGAPEGHTPPTLFLNARPRCSPIGIHYDCIGYWLPAHEISPIEVNTTGDPPIPVSTPPERNWFLCPARFSYRRRMFSARIAPITHLRVIRFPTVRLSVELFQVIFASRHRNPIALLPFV